jgi:MFS family permease
LELLGSAFLMVAAIGGIFALARFSEAFLVRRAFDAGLSFAWSPLALAVMNLTYVVSAYPAGRLSDRIGRTGLLAMGLVILIGADVMLAVGTSLLAVLFGVALWGLHMGLTQGLLAAMVADTAPATLRGSAFGVFHFVTGLAALLASLIAGQLWDWRGPELTFYAGAIFSAVALAGLIGWRMRFAAQ